MEISLLIILLLRGVNGITFNPSTWEDGKKGSFFCDNDISVLIKKNDVQVITCATDGTNACNQSPPPYATTNIDGKTVTFTIEEVNRSRDSAVWSCAGKSESIDVKASVPSVTIINKNSLTFTDEQTTSITCKTGVSNPYATITWSIGGTNINGGTTTNNPEGTTTSIYQYNATKTDHNKILQCSATNGFGSPKSDSMTLNIRYVPTVRINPESQLPVCETQGDELKLTCVVVDANPSMVSSYMWSRDDMVIPDEQNQTFIRSPVLKTNEGSYTCAATNSAGTGQTSVQVKVEVRVGVPNVTIVNKDSLTFNNGQPTSITCKTTGVSYPPATITWSIGGTDKNGATTTNNPDGTTTSIYQYTADITDNNKTLQCSASNGCGSPKSDSLTLIIIAAPEIIGGQDCISVAVIVYSNPHPKCEWLFNGKASNETFTIVSDGYQHTCKLSSYSNPRDIPSGDYNVNISNARGWTSHTINIPQIKDPFPDYLLAVQIIHIVAVFLVFLVISCSDQGAKFMQGVSITSVVLIVVCMGLLIYLLVKLQEDAWIITSSLVIVFTVLTAVIIIIINRISILTKIKDEHWYVGLVVSCVITILFSLATLIYLVVTLSQYDVCKEEYLGAGVGFQAVDVLVIALLLVTVLKMKTGSGTSRYHVCRVVWI